MKVYSIPSNVSFCATLTNTNHYSKTTKKFEKRESTDEEILESYDDTLKTMANRTKLAFELDKLMQDSDIQRQIEKVQDKYNELCIATDLFSSYYAQPHDFSFITPSLDLHSEDEELSEKLSLSDKNDANLKEKIMAWLKRYSGEGKRTEPIEITYLANPQEVKKGCDEISAEILKRKHQQEELFKLMKNDKEICAILDEIPDDIEIEVGQTCQIEQQDEDYLVPSDVYPLDIVAYIPTEIHNDYKRIEFTDFNSDGSVNRKALIDWLNALKN